MLDVVGILKGLSKEDRGRCMRSAEIDDELSSMSGRNSGGGDVQGSNLTPATVFNAVWVMSTDPGIFVILIFSLVGSEEICKFFFFKGRMHVKGEEVF